MAGVHGAGGDATGLRTFEDAKSTLYGTISAAGAALEKASKRRESTVTSVAAYLDRIQLDLSGLSVIHVTGTKGKGSTCAMVESILRHHGFRTGLYTSPHLLEVTERVRCDGKPLTKEAFARYFFQVWDRLQDTAAPTNTDDATAAATAAATGTTGITAAASEGPSQAEQGPAAPEEEGTTAPEMPTYFHLLTLVGLWCFVQEGVDVCVLEVGMGGRFDATNVVPSPVACGVAMLDLDHTQVLGDTLDKIAWEKGGIFKEGCRAMAVEQPRGGMSVLCEASQQCAAAAGCGELEVVKPLPTRDPCGRAYEIGLAGDHQRVNAALALRLCAVWIEAHRQQQQQQHAGDQAPPAEKIHDTETFWASADVHRGLSCCVWPGRCQVFRPPAFPSVTIYLDGAHTEQSMRACLGWFVEKTATAAASRAKADEVASSRAAVAVAVTPLDIPRSSPPPPPPQLERRRQNRRCRRVLWFNASHERDVVPLLDMLASARRRESCDGSSGNATNTTNKDDDDDADGDTPLFDEAWFMEVIPGRPSRFKLPTAQEILAPHGISPAVAAAAATSAGMAGASSVSSGPCSDDPSGEEPAGGAAPGCGEEKADGAGAGSGAGAWQRTLEQVWTSLQTRRGGTLSATLTGTAPFFFEKLSLICANSQHDGGSEAASVVGDPGVASRTAVSAVDADHHGSGGRGDASVAATGCGDRGGRVDSEIVEVLCTGSLYAVAAALEAFGAEVE
ncbi:conserved unknown protein [Ectocarpus siliculosus]|uniref:tetrahydrofolate synthase n=1 Tax=Ectocarpus siliculosus TaxID=2880 RepID=D7FNM0_ECTSI|nr:conserved unknown protein [Ectocarpus siliculosus]|eukprot:CBJ26031.1 conserved unknown protein [Ectocarpus siliculosus]